jgi:signal transduction histidine kinase/CheY-like chemotaxis protein
MLEVPLEQLLGSSIYQYVSSDDEGLLRALLWEALIGPAKRDFNLAVSQNKTIPVHFTANPLKLEGVNLICLLATDLTEHYALLNAQAEASQARQAADELRRARDVADAANRAKDQFLAVLSHELRTPLSPAVLVLSALADHPELPADVREDLAMVHRNIELETRLIDDLLDLSRVINGKLHLHTAPTSAHGVLRQAMQLCAADAEGKGIRITAHLAAVNDLISADAARLQQVFWNLLKNAIKFSPEGAQIEIRSENVRSKDDPRGTLRIRFIDVGIGIAGEHLTAIFNAFEQADSAIAHRFGGLGLGLTVAKAIMELHGGKIWAESPGKNRGSTFTVEFSSCAAVDNYSAPMPQCDLSAARLCILIVEDHADTAKALHSILSLQGHTVKCAASVAEALKLAEELQCDLLISDLGLPDGTGYELLPRLRERFPNLVAIALSGYGSENDIRRSIDVGFAEHLTKPIEPAVLEQAIHRAVSR